MVDCERDTVGAPERTAFLKTLAEKVRAAGLQPRLVTEALLDSLEGHATSTWTIR